MGRSSRRFPMNLKHGFVASGLVLGAVALSLGVTQLRAAQDPILSYCPPHVRNAVDCATAVKMFLQFGHPTDDELITAINGIAAALDGGHISRAGYRDAGEGLLLLAQA